MNRSTPTIVVTVKNRLEHFLKTFPFNVSQVGCKYRLLYVDFDSEDDFKNVLLKTVKNNIDMFSKDLIQIKLVELKTKEKYAIGRAKNLGVAYASKESDIVIVSDADTILGMDYVKKWSSLTVHSKTFVTNRIQENKAQYPKRISPEVNYGNIVVSSKDFFDVKGYDESYTGWGGDDDDLFHRLKLKGLREINPHSLDDSSQYSIIHSDELRFKYIASKAFNKKTLESVKETHDKVYSNKSRLTSKLSNCLSEDYYNKITEESILYEKHTT